MWTKLDDELFSHPKIFAAGATIGKNGPAIALGFYAAALLFANKHLTDGILPMQTVAAWSHVDSPLKVADALARAGLFDKIKGGWRIHDFNEYNPSAKAIREKRKEDRLRKQRDRAGQGNGAAS